jgi:hypothetical protein
MSLEILTPTTELEAVNEILATIGEAPLNTLAGALPSDAATALTRLRSRSRSLQAKGWSFNMDFNFRMSPNGEGEIALPANALSVDATDDLHIISRGRRLYDRVNHTFKIGRAVQCDVIRFLPFDELPEYARQFIFMAAARRFQDQLLGDEALHQFTQRDETMAWAAFLDAEAEAGDYNVLRDSPSVSRIIMKRGVS